jgi:hypothetical protein
MAITLLCWCRNDSEVSSAAKAFKADYRYSGCRVAALPQTLGRLGGDDILIITAHGSSHSIGESDDSFIDLTVDKLAGLLKQLAPSTWSGSLYLDVCNGLAFARNLKAALNGHFPNLKLFGCDGDTDMSVDMSKHKQA